MRHAPVSISFSTRDLLSFFSFRAHLLGGGRRPPERTRLNSAVRHQLGSRFVLTLGIDRRLRWPGSRSLIYTSTVAHEDGFALPPLRLSGAGGGRRPHHLLSPAGRDSSIFGHAARLDPGAGTPRNRCLPATCGTGAAPACAPPPPRSAGPRRDGYAAAPRARRRRRAWPAPG